MTQPEPGHYRDDGAPLAEIVQRYEAAWKQALRGGAVPDLETQVARVEAAQQATLRASLRQIEQRYRPLLSRETHSERVDPTVGLDGPTVRNARQPPDAPAAEPPRAIDATAAMQDGLAPTMDPGGAAGSVDVTQSRLDHTKDYLVASDTGKAPPAEFPRIAGYEIRSVLGRGGMGVVYRARQVGLNRIVALKMILAGGHASAEQLTRFHAEAEAVAQLHHPNIVQVYDVGRHDGLPFFSLEFVDGRPLSDEIDGKPLLPARAAELVEQVARAMQHAHQHGIVHRDLKPANILMTKDGQPKVTDFGLVKRLEADSSQTRTGTIMGTPSYMAPEQGRGEKNLGPAADVYALGGILYCTLTGRPPFVGATAMDTLLLALNDEPVPPSRLQPKTPRDLETICLKCLQKEPAKRYRSAEDLAEDLRRFREGEPISARPVGAVERAWRWCVRNPRLAAATAAALALLLVLATGGPVAALLINQQRREAVTARALAEERLDVARGSLETLIYTVQDKLKGQRGSNELRRELINLAIDGLERVLEKDEGDSTPDILAASAYRKLGGICIEVGEGERAIRSYEKSLELALLLLERGQLNDPNMNLANVYYDLGSALALYGDTKQAEQRLLKALEHWLERRQLHPDDRTALDSLAKTYGKLATVASFRGDTEAQRRYTFEGLQIRKEWLEADPQNIAARTEYAGAMQDLAKLSLDSGDPATAEEQGRLCIEMFRELAALQPGNFAHRSNLALRIMWLGFVQLIREEFDLAEQTLREAALLMDAESQENPDDAYLRGELGNTHYLAGIASTAVGRLQEGRQHHQRALDIRRQLLSKDATSPSKRYHVMLSLARCGQGDESARMAAQLRAEYPDNALVMINCSCTEALLADLILAERSVEQLSPAERDRYQIHRRQAIADITQVLESGFKHFFPLRTDPDTDGLRKFPEYLELLDEAEQAAAAEAEDPPVAAPQQVS